MPSVAVLCVVGSFALRNNFFDVYIMLIFGLIGICMKWLDMPVVPLLLALVLGSQFEENLRVALTASQGDISVFVTSPISLSFIILSLISVIWSLKSNKNKKQSNDA
jgi:putative tricarboxylic transport membrane protein